MPLAMTMRKMYLFIVIAVITGLLSAATVGSASALNDGVSIQSVNVDEASGFVTIHGKIASGSSKQVTITFTEPNGRLDYLNQTTSGVNGFFAFTYLPSVFGPGEYLMRVGGEDINTPHEQRIKLNEVSGGAVLKGVDSIQPGQTFDIVYGLSGVNGDVIAQDMTIEFDQSKLEFVSAKSLNEEKFTIVDYKEKAGKIRFLSVHLNGNDANPIADYMKLTFKAKADLTPGMTNLHVSELIIADSLGVETALQGVSHGIQIGVVDKTVLNALIAEAQQLHNKAIEGNGVGQYPAGSKSALQSVIDRAALVAGNDNATQIMVSNAVDELNAAMQAFKASVITKIVGDFNNDERVSIGDLAILAKSYGMTSNDSGWDAVKGYDLNHDGKIDIEDLAALARLILNWL